MPGKYSNRWLHERELIGSGLTRLAGVDEAGRGPLAGPVVAAAVVFPVGWIRGEFPSELRELNDSKQLTAARREEFFALLVTRREVEYGVACTEPGIIDAINILQATHRAMNEALRQLQPPPHHVLVDGYRANSLILPQTALVDGDARSYSIAAASVVAKVTRDRLMCEADACWPHYGFARHKGYATPEHLDALARFGPCEIHRRSFSPVRQPELELFPE